MKKSFLLILCIFLISSCGVKVNKKVDLEQVYEMTKKKKEQKIEEELSALQRKAEILEKIHQYSPYIKMINVYIPAQQKPDGTFVHSQIITVPLIFRPIEGKKIKPSVAEEILNKSKETKASKKNNQEKETLNNSNSVSFNQSQNSVTSFQPTQSLGNENQHLIVNENSNLEESATVQSIETPIGKVNQNNAIEHLIRLSNQSKTNTNIEITE